MFEKRGIERESWRRISEHSSSATCGPEHPSSCRGQGNQTSTSTPEQSGTAGNRRGQNGGRMRHMRGFITTLRVKISGLAGATVKVHASVPRLSSRQSELVRFQAKPEPPTPAAPVSETPAVPKVVETARQVPVKVIPSPRKRQPRLPKPEPEVPPVPVALKVIRRRREQAPKVFEKTVKSFPKGMLEGVELHTDELEEGRPETGQ